MSYKNEILDLYKKGYNYAQICKELGCAKSTVSYHVAEGQKQKVLERRRDRRKDVDVPKYERYKYRELSAKNQTSLRGRSKGFRDSLANSANPLTLKQVKLKMEETDICYLCGDKINYSQPLTYHFDHIVSIFNGGNNTIDNLGIVHAMCNMAKTSMSVEEFVNLCYRVAKHNNKI